MYNWDGGTGRHMTPKPGQSCFTCEHWKIEHPQPYSATCLHGVSIHVRSMPERGCAMWVRATGHDDEEK
jgi:hypothetical protein